MALRNTYTSDDVDEDDGLQVLPKDLRTLKNFAWRKLKHILQLHIVAVPRDSSPSTDQDPDANSVLNRDPDHTMDSHHPSPPRALPQSHDRTLPKLKDILALGTEKAVRKFFHALRSTAAQWWPTDNRAQQAGRRVRFLPLMPFADAFAHFCQRLASLMAPSVTAAEFPSRTSHAIPSMSLLDKKQMNVFTLDTWTRILREDLEDIAKGVYLWDAHLQEKVLVIGALFDILGDAPGWTEFTGFGTLVRKRHLDDDGAEDCESVQPRGSYSRAEDTARALHPELKESITEIAQDNENKIVCMLSSFAILAEKVRDKLGEVSKDLLPHWNCWLAHRRYLRLIWGHQISERKLPRLARHGFVFTYGPLKERETLDMGLPEAVKQLVRITRFIPAADLALSSVKLAHLAGVGEGSFPGLENGGLPASVLPDQPSTKHLALPDPTPPKCQLMDPLDPLTSLPLRPADHRGHPRPKFTQLQAPSSAFSSGHAPGHCPPPHPAQQQQYPSFYSSSAATSLPVPFVYNSSPALGEEIAGRVSTGVKKVLDGELRKVVSAVIPDILERLTAANLKLQPQPVAPYTSSK
ncbi:hypothetical protein BDK51DRAFT_39759 [Blyttiomyces helicus]|uniref:Uncharacterized protein n=1 Tax=Blyttiomyces helicus TaxID=388810 RepID=A0A4P9W6S1_9FUNG|nr:hypothetical protein BDK51DRAFT_39759 [Blyttiomyces helicus]|eukprot:RKO85826.1 hypothetical protein BDK51DRAFT_39759 [Blyttiomyces helicus]